MHLRLEPLDLNHASELFDALNHEQIGLFIGGPDVNTLTELEDRIQHLQKGPKEETGQRWYSFAVLLDSVVIGRVEATAHDGIVEIAYLLNPSLWGQGLGTAATELLLNELRMDGERDFWATAVPENVASVRVVEHLGFREIDADLAPELLSFDKGDRVFNLKDGTLS
jgi:RimJ/RimL family protein N-acetyltransferase